MSCHPRQVIRITLEDPDLTRIVTDRVGTRYRLGVYFPSFVVFLHRLPRPRRARGGGQERCNLIVWLHLGFHIRVWMSVFLALLVGLVVVIACRALGKKVMTMTMVFVALMRMEKNLLPVAESGAIGGVGRTWLWFL